jgi:plasmid replication initiation protein
MSVFNKDNPFTKFTIKYAMGLNGYALKLYPMFVQNDFRHTFDVAIFDLKKALNIDADAYSEFKEFKKFVLKPSIESINEKTELNVTYKAVKKGGRKATHIEFTVTKATSKVNEPATSEPATSEPATSEPAITAMILFSHIQKNALIERLKEYGESTDEFIARLKVDLRDGKQQYWLQKLEEFGVSL